MVKRKEWIQIICELKKKKKKKKIKNPSRFIMNIFLLEAINVNLYSFSK